MPRPWISRTSPKPRAWASRRYSSTTERISRGWKACRSSESSIWILTGSSVTSESRARLQVLRPVLKAREILPRELALSERRRALEERDVDHRKVLGARGVGDLLRHHLTHERNGDTRQAMEHLVGATDPRARQHGAALDARLVRRVLAGLRHELLQAQRHVLGDPGLDARLGVGGRAGRAIERVAQRAEEPLEAPQARFQSGEPSADVVVSHGASS